MFTKDLEPYFTMLGNVMDALKREYAYVVVVVASIFLGELIRRIRNTTVKKTASTLLGFAIALIFCGYEVYHSILSIFVGSLLIKAKGDQPRAVFIFSFLYRLFFCLSPYLGLERNENNLANGIQLVITIKLISVAYEVCEFRKRRRNGPDEPEQSISVKPNAFGMTLLEEPTWLDIICYMYCFIGITAGPFFRYRTYYDMIHMPSKVAQNLPRKNFVVKKMYCLVVLYLFSMCCSKFFDVKHMKSNDFYTARSTFFRFLYVIPVGLNGMARYGFVWILSECAFAIAGLGVYPNDLKPKPGCGPTVFNGNDQIWKDNEDIKTIELNYDTVKNVDIYEGFRARTYAKTFRWWNCCVQWWMAHFVYSSNLFPKQLTFVRLTAVATVAAVWHGFKAGYYFSFMGMPYIAFAEHLSMVQFGSHLEPGYKKLFVVAHWFSFKVIGICSFMTTFLLSDFESIMRYLTSVYFGVYAISTAVIVITMLIRLARFINRKLYNTKTIKSD